MFTKYIARAALFQACVLLTKSSVYAEDGPVTCGSAIKITHVPTGYFLHSSDARFNGGSGQRTVTMTPDRAHSDSLFQVREANNSGVCSAAAPIKCGDVIRLTHMNSNQNLHSHNVRSILMGRMDPKSQEVSLFGDSGEGDGGDNWVVNCDTGNWMRSQKVTFMHVDTGKYLTANKDTNYNDQNCRGCPIVGHLEAYAHWPFDENNISFKTEIGIHLS